MVAHAPVPAIATPTFLFITCTCNTRWYNGGVSCLFVLGVLLNAKRQRQTQKTKKTPTIKMNTFKTEDAANAWGAGAAPTCLLSSRHDASSFALPLPLPLSFLSLPLPSFNSTQVIAGRTLFPFQEHGVQWMIGEENAPTRIWGQSVRGGLLCDEMGLGKTLQTIAVILRRPVARTLIAVPVSVMRPWQEALCEAGCSVWELQAGDKVRRVALATEATEPEAKAVAEAEPEAEPEAAEKAEKEKEIEEGEIVEDENVETPCFPTLRYWGPAINIESMPGTGENAQAQHTPRDGPCVVVATYGTIKPRERLLREAEMSDASVRPFNTVAWDRIVADEGHVLRTPHTLIALRMQRLVRAPGCAAWVLTGTPVHNALEDLFALFAFVGYNMMGVDKKGDDGLHAAAEAWAAKATRRTMANIPPEVRVGMAYPSEDFVVVNHEVVYRSTSEAEFYRSATGILEGQITALERYTDRREAAQHRLVITSFVRMLAVNPCLYIAACNKQRSAQGLPLWPPWEGRVSKNEQVMELVQSWAAERASFVLFTHYTEELVQFKSVVKALGFPALVIDGSQSARARFETLAQSRELSSRGVMHALLLQIQAGGVGMNAQHISRVIIPSPDWSVAAEAQAIARCHRIGQTRRVEVHRFFLADVVRAGMQIEKHILSKQATKRTLIDRVVTSVDR